MGKFCDLTNQRFGRLVVIELAYRIDKRIFWKCQCDCGRTHTVRGDILKRGDSKSCGCLNDEVRIATATKHGLHGIPEYFVWATMKDRCTNSNSRGYQHYGARGIKVCERWLKLENFYEDMGLRPSNRHTIERIDNDGDYCPENCKWATYSEQMKNNRRTRMVTFNGRTQCIKDWSIELGIHINTLRVRLERGWSIEKAFTTRPMW